MRHLSWLLAVLCITACSTPAPQPKSTALVRPGPASTSASRRDLSPDEKVAVSHGYRLQIQNGQRMFCRMEAKLGTRFEEKVCASAESIVHRLDRDQDTLLTPRAARGMPGQ